MVLIVVKYFFHDWNNSSLTVLYQDEISNSVLNGAFINDLVS